MNISGTKNKGETLFQNLMKTVLSHLGCKDTMNPFTFPNFL